MYHVYSFCQIPSIFSYNPVFFYIKFMLRDFQSLKEFSLGCEKESKVWPIVCQISYIFLKFPSIIIFETTELSTLEPL